MNNFQVKINVQNRTNQSKEQTEKKQRDRSIQIMNSMANKNHDTPSYPCSFCNYNTHLSATYILKSSAARFYNLI